MVTDKVLMTNISDNDEDISFQSYLTNLMVQSVNAYLMSFIFIGHNLFLYLGGVVLIYRLRTIAMILKDLKGSHRSKKLTMKRRRRILIECHLMYVDVNQ